MSHAAVATRTLDATGVDLAVVHYKIGRSAGLCVTAAVALALITIVVILGPSTEAQDSPSDDNLPELIGEPYAEARDKLLELDFEVELQPQDFAADDDVVVVIEVGGDLTDRYIVLFLGTFVPDLQGEQGSDVSKILDRHDLRLEIDGEFVDEWEVVYQSPPPDTLLGFGEAVLVALEPASRGGTSWWAWFLLISIAVVGLVLVRRVWKRPSRKPTEGRQDRGAETPHQVRADPVPGHPRIGLKVPSGKPIGHTIRFSPVVGAASHATEELDT